MKILFLAVVQFLLVVSNGAPAEDEITNLPGLTPAPTFKQYSGYLDATDGRHLHYWFVESQDVDPVTAPLVFWFNGGPGCSSMDGFLTENGPYRVNEDGQTLYYNEYSWNKIANMVFLEAPAGVGFSYKDDPFYVTTDTQTAVDNYEAVQNFFVKFPEYLQNPFFVTGESYAGIYVPTLSYLIANGSSGINFQAFAVGNGLHDDRFNYNSEILFEGYHGLFDQDVLNDALTHCCTSSSPLDCNFYDSTDEDCVSAVYQAELASALSNVNPYGIYNLCNYRDGTGVPVLYPKGFSEEQINTLQNLKQDPPCSNSQPERTYLNTPEVRAALHIPDTVQYWDMCSDVVELGYDKTLTSMTTEYEFLLNHVRALIYNGDTDTTCNYIGAAWFADSLGREVLKPYRPWFYANQTAGFAKDYDNLTYVTVLGAGHMVPTDRPAQALQVFSNFINNVDFN